MSRMMLSAAALAAALSLAAVPAFASSTKTITVKDNAFSPSSATIRAGSTVKFVWRGKAPHNVSVSKGPAKFKSPVKTSGSYAIRLTRKGTYSLVCTIHQGMKMSLRVN
jgi:plastocyanin